MPIDIDRKLNTPSLRIHMLEMAMLKSAISDYDVLRASNKTSLLLAASLNVLVSACHNSSLDAGWWKNESVIVDDEIREVHPLSVPAKLCLIHSEISEAMEGYRKNLMDDKLPHRTMIEVELADALIRIFDLAGALKLDLGGAVIEKMAYNAVRPDHKPEARAGQHGKKF